MRHGTLNKQSKVTCRAIYAVINLHLMFCALNSPLFYFPVEIPFGGTEEHQEHNSVPQEQGTTSEQPLSAAPNIDDRGEKLTLF